MICCIPGHTGGPYLLNRGRRLSPRELSFTMGINLAEWQLGSMSSPQWGHAIGNGTPLNLAERVLGAAMLSTGMIREHNDRWLEPRSVLGR